MGIIYFLLIITALVFIHELGHFIFAKLFGVQILEFAIGIGPMLFGFKRKDVLYRFNAFPIGGYVRLAGESTYDEENVPQEKMFYRKPAWQRILISSAGPLFSILTGYVVFILATVIWGYTPVAVDRVEENSPAYKAGIREGDIILDVNGRKIFDISDFVDMVKDNDELRITVMREKSEEEIVVKPNLLPAEVEFTVEGKGIIPSGKLLKINDLKVNEDEIYDVLYPLLNQKVVLGFEDGKIEGILKKISFTPKRKAVGIYFKVLSPVIQKASKPFMKGDRIIRIGNWNVKDGVDLSRIYALISSDLKEGFLIRLSGNKTYYSMYMNTQDKFDVEIIRGEKKVTFEYNYENLKKYLMKELLFSTGVKQIKPGPLKSLFIGTAMTNNFLKKMGRIIGMLVTGKTGLNNFVGPIGLVGVVRNVARYGIEPLILLTAIITLNLGLINLFPLPALDGGRIAFALVELITRRRLDPKIENYIHMIGFILLMALMVYITYVDILRLVGK